MSDGAGPFLTVLWGRARRVRHPAVPGRMVVRNGVSERYKARMAWPWDALPDLERITWDWPRR